jgi:hypothetical protein
MTPPPPRAGARLALAALLAAPLACADTVLVRATSPVAGPGPGGATSYAVGRLVFEVPAGWAARGDPRHLSAAQPEGFARLDVQVADRAFRDEAECLAQAEEALQKGAGEVQGMRRHPTTFAGRPGQAAEGDQGAWHGWAWAVCDGVTQYRVSFFGATPLRDDVLAAWNAFTRSARLQP